MTSKTSETYPFDTVFDRQVGQYVRLGYPRLLCLTAISFRAMMTEVRKGISRSIREQPLRGTVPLLLVLPLRMITLPTILMRANRNRVVDHMCAAQLTEIKSDGAVSLPDHPYVLLDVTASEVPDQINPEDRALLTVGRRDRDIDNRSREFRSVCVLQRHNRPLLSVHEGAALFMLRPSVFVDPRTPFSCWGSRLGHQVPMLSGIADPGKEMLRVDFFDEHEREPDPPSGRMVLTAFRRVVSGR